MNKIGANGEGFTSRYNQLDVDMLSILAKDKKFVMRWPGGSDAKNAYPSPDVVGLGMREDAINSFYDLYGKDENSEGREGDLNKYQQDLLDDQSQLIDIVNISRDIPNLQIIYCLNIFAEASINSNAIQYLLDNGVDVVGIVAGNELYFTLSFDVNKYLDLIIPHLVECGSRFPFMPFALCFGQDVNRSTHKKWNDELVSFINVNSQYYRFAVDTHPYLSTSELNDALVMHPAYSAFKAIPNGLIYGAENHAALEAAFAKYNELWSATSYYNDCFNYFKTNLPNCPIWVSEFGCIPVEYWGNTLSNGAFYFSTFLTHSDSVEMFLLHNLQGNFFWAAMFDHVPHVQYYVLQMLQELGTNTGALNQIIPYSTLSIEGVGEYFFPFVNLGSEFNGSIVSGAQYQVETAERVCVMAPYNYSTEGAAGFYAKKIGRDLQVIPNDINGVKREVVFADHFNVPVNSFGYIKVTTKKRTIFGCTDMNASNYNPSATDDDGSCVFPPPVKGCTDPKANNYMIEATVDNGSCIYDAPVFYGCTDPKARNYNPKATCDDGSCKYRRKTWWNPFSWFGN